MQDPHTYPNSNVLINHKDIRNNVDLERFEKNRTEKRIIELRKNPEVVKGNQDYPHLKAIHKYIFQDVYPFAGEERKINMGKSEQLLNGESVGYAPVGYIGPYAQKHLDNIKSIDFTQDKNKAFNDYANEITEVWVAHAFREGNTRTIAAFMEQNLESKGIEMDMVSLNKQHDLRDYFVRAYGGDIKPLVKAIEVAHKDKVIDNAKEKLKDTSPENQAAVTKFLIDKGITLEDIQLRNPEQTRKDNEGWER